MTSPQEGVSTQSVKLKVLYTFDSDQKDNHLARWPHSVDIQTAFIDDATRIGVIDLRTCLEAVCTASPELVSKIDSDYAIYAYDYSEPDTPLVGQGRLSKAMSTPQLNDENENEAMVTGKITKNIMGLFSKNAQETLEVKLRLTPVAAQARQLQRSDSITFQNSFSQQWSNTSQNPQSLPTPALTHSNSVDAAGLETVQRMLSEGGAPRDRSNSFVGDSFYAAPSRAGSRPGTPTLPQAVPVPARQPSSRPVSRAEMRQPNHRRSDSFNSGYYSAEENFDDGPSRKRAKMTKVEWPTRSDLNIERQPNSLRMAASAASSVRLHRPVAFNPTMALQTGVSAEEPVRPPTPVPASKSSRGPGRPRKVISSNLIHGSRARDSSPAMEANSQRDFLDANFSSPEETRARSVSTTPANFPSSPPVMPEHHDHITSPALPPLTNNHDSGFMSGNLDDMFIDDTLFHIDDFIIDKPFDEIENMTADAPSFPPMDKYTPVFDDADIDEPITNSTSNTTALQNVTVPGLNHVGRAQSFTPASRINMSSPKLAPAPISRPRPLFEGQRERPTPILPRIPFNDQSGRTFQRSHTWAPDTSDAIMSEGPTEFAGQPRGSGKKRVGKAQTKARCDNAIASGQMPPYCDNCGAIETPAWRRAFIKVFDCPWDSVETSLEHGACCYKTPIELNPDGTVKLFKGYKAERRSDDKNGDWVQISLCNPCGLWFHKQKCPRPPEKWQKKDQNRIRKRKRAPKSQKAVTRSTTMHLRSEDNTPASDESSPADMTEGPDGDDNMDEGAEQDEDNGEDSEPQLPPLRHHQRSNSVDVSAVRRYGDMLAAHREVRSSPARHPASDHDPIEIDLTPKPLRRQLFPSPVKNAPVEIRSDSLPVAAVYDAENALPRLVRRSPRLNKTRDVFNTFPEAANVVAVTTDGKENMNTTILLDDGLAHLFDEADLQVALPPATPKRRSDRLLFKTPSKTPQRLFGAEMSPNMLPSPHTRSKTKQSAEADHADDETTSRGDIAKMTPFSRTIYEALSDAPEWFADPKTPASTRSKVGSKKQTPKDNGFDFPDLPSLHDSSPASSNPLLLFNFSELTTDQLNSDSNEGFSTDAPMPSSPPPDFFSFVNAEELGMGHLWEDLEPTGHEHGQADKHQMLRRSPRRHR